ncbi:MAG: hypothetical protein IJP52_00080 [Paludibacteraceae bacterium]|nr:hypothetical protein [Paludibacteraceae bacterium]
MYKFSFTSVGGATRVKIQNGEDIRHLNELDDKMWTVLSCPTSGLEIADESLQMMDADGDGQLHVNEVKQAADWLSQVLKDTDTLFLGSAEQAISNIADEEIAAVAKGIDAEKISLEAVDAVVAAVTIDEQPVPEAPYAADVIAAYKACQEAYAAYFQKAKLAKLGLETLTEEDKMPPMKEKDFVAMGKAIADWEAAAAAATEANNAALAAAKGVYQPLRKLLLLSRDFVLLLRNYVTLEDFYNRDTKAIFQAGTLVIDQRACQLCIRANDMAKQEAQAPASGMFLVYCDCTSKKLGKTMKIVAALTLGEVKNVTVGKNALFYDRQGNDWDATVYKIIDNPISIRQAFWSPYRRMAQWVEDMINKRAAEKDSKAFSDMTAKAEEAANKPIDAAAAEKKQAFDIAKFAGIFAAIGMALGMIGSALVSVAGGFRTLTWWQDILVIAAILLIISGPAMILAAIKLRRRNLAPILNANGWAVNADSKVNIPFGATLTEQVSFPLLKLPKKGLSLGAKWAIALTVIVVAIAALLVVVFFAPEYCQCPVELFCK